MSQDVPAPNVAALARSRYRAFISYSHADQPFARKLHRRLETYKLPRSLILPGDTGRLGKVCLDREELGAPEDLPAAVESALADSESLVVVVSPSSMESRWVRAEVQAFRKLRPKGRILWISVPKHGGLSPKALFEGTAAESELAIAIPRQPLVVDVDKVGFEEASLALIAALFGRDFDELRNRERLRQRRTRRIWSAGIAAVTAVVLGLGLLSFVAAIQSSRERSRALAGQSELLAAQAVESIRAGDGTLATRLALAALPAAEGDRPYAWQAAVALSRSAQHLRSVAQVDYSGEQLELLAPSAKQAGRRLALSRSGKLHLVGPGDTTETLSLETQKGGIKSALYARQHALLLAQSGKQLVSWNEDTRVQSIKALPDEPNCLTLAPDGSALVITYGTQVEVLGLPGLSGLHHIALAKDSSGECAVFSRARGAAFIVTMTSDGKHLVEAVDVEHQGRVSLGTLDDVVLNMTIAPDDSTAAIAVGSNAVVFWKLDGTPEFRRLATTETPRMMMPVSLGFADAGRRLLVGDNAGRVHFFDAGSRQRTDVFAEHDGASVMSLVVDPAESIVHTADSQGIGKSWSMAPLLDRWGAPAGGRADALDSVVSRSGNRVVTRLFDGQVLEWDPSRLDAPLAATLPCGKALRLIAVSDGGDSLAAGCDAGEIFTWKAGAQTPTQVHRAGGAIDDLRFGSNGQLRYAARNGTFGEVRVGGQVVEVKSAGSSDRIVEIPGSSRVLVVDRHGSGIVHDLGDNREIRRLANPSGLHPANQNFLGGVVTDSGRYAAIGGADDRLRIWDLTDGRLVAEAAFERGSRDALVTGPRDQLAFLEKGIVHVWSPDLQAPRALAGTYPTGAVAFVPGRPRHLATAAARDAVWLWDLDSGTRYAQVALRSRGPDDGIGRDLFFVGKEGALVGLTTRQGPVLAASPPPTRVLMDAVKRHAPLVAGHLSKQDTRRFALPMESMLQQQSDPVFGVTALDDMTDRALRSISGLDRFLRDEGMPAAPARP